MTAALVDADVDAEAARLDAAERNRRQIPATTTRFPDATIADAYRIQQAWRDLRVARGERIIGHKIGLTSKVMQVAMNIDTPDSGFLTDAMVFEPGSELDAEAFLDLRVEVEVAFVLGRRLTGACLDIDDVLDATAYVQPAVELIAARSHRVDPTTGRTRTVVDTIADNAADAGVVCGGAQLDPSDVDLRWLGATAARNGEIEQTGLAAAVLGHPANGVAWLAARYAEHGLELNAGDVILSGSFTSPLTVHPGDRFDFDFGPHGSFPLTFTTRR